MLKIKSSKGFTLIELLVVIAIIAILSVVVILTLNPAELLKQARDSTRVSDMSTLKTAISQYLSDVSSPVLTTRYDQCGISNVTSSASAITNCGFAETYFLIGASSSRAVDGTGWIPVNFGSISSGAPFGNLPADPVNTGSLVYRYAASSTNLLFEVDALLESTKQTGSTGASQNDGGDGGGGTASTSLFESGNSLRL